MTAAPSNDQHVIIRARPKSVIGTRVQLRSASERRLTARWIYIHLYSVPPLIGQFYHRNGQGTLVALERHVYRML
jgi:hypothetical protein